METRIKDRIVMRVSRLTEADGKDGGVHVSRYPMTEEPTAFSSMADATACPWGGVYQEVVAMDVLTAAELEDKARRYDEALGAVPENMLPRVGALKEKIGTLVRDHAELSRVLGKVAGLLGWSERCQQPIERYAVTRIEELFETERKYKEAVAARDKWVPKQVGYNLAYSVLMLYDSKEKMDKFIAPLTERAIALGWNEGTPLLDWMSTVANDSNAVREYARSRGWNLLVKPLAAWVKDTVEFNSQDAAKYAELRRMADRRGRPADKLSVVDWYAQQLTPQSVVDWYAQQLTLLRNANEELEKKVEATRDGLVAYGMGSGESVTDFVGNLNWELVRLRGVARAHEKAKEAALECGWDGNHPLSDWLREKMKTPTGVGNSIQVNVDLKPGAVESIAESFEEGLAQAPPAPPPDHRTAAIERITATIAGLTHRALHGPQVECAQTAQAIATLETVLATYLH